MNQSLILENMQKTHKKLLQSRYNTKKYVENLIEYAMYGDAKDEDVFDYFAEENILGLIYLQMKKQDTLTTAFIIEKISMLFTNVKKELNMNYLLSNPILNDFIKFPYNFSIPEMVDFYVNFLKTIAQRVDKHNFNLYFNQKYSSFPLLWQTQKFLSYPDSLVRNTVQNIILSLTKLASPDQQNLQTQSIIFQSNKLVTQFKNYLLYSPFIFVYNQYIHQYLLGIISLEHESSEKDLKEIDERNLDIILFFQDLFKSVPFLGDVLVGQFMGMAVKPILDCILLGKSKFLNIGCQFGLYVIYSLMSHLPIKYVIIKQLMDDKIDDYQAFTKNWDKKWQYLDETSDQALQKYFDQIFNDKWEPIITKLNQIDNPYKQQFQHLLRSKDGVLLNLTLAILQIIQEEKREINYSRIVDILDYENVQLQTWDIVSYLVQNQASVEKELQDKFQKQKYIFDQFVEHCGNNEPKSLFANWQLIDELQRQSIADRKVIITVNALIPSFETVDMSHLKIVYKYLLLTKLVFGETPQIESKNPYKVGNQIDRFLQKGKFIQLSGKEEFMVLDEDQGKLMHIVSQQGTQLATVKFIEPLRAIEASMKEDVLTIEGERHSLSPVRGYQLQFNRNNAEEILKAIFVAQKQCSEKMIIKLLQLQI